MRAAVVTSIGKLEVMSVPLPTLGPYDVLCKMCYGSTCAGTDIHLMNGLHPFPVSFPTILGHESVGRVVEVGKKVENFKIGDLVTRVGAPQIDGLSSNWGGFAEYGIAKDHWQMRKDGLDISLWNKSRVNQIVHPSIDEKTAPMIITWRETLSYVRRLGVNENSKVLLIGSGANALSIAAHLRNIGCEAITVGSMKRSSDFISLGISSYLDYKSSEIYKELEDSFSPFDFIIDAVGASDLVNTLVPLLKHDGTLAIYGWNGRSCYSLNPFNLKDNISIYMGGYDEEESNGEVQALILEGKLDARLWYDLDNPIDLENIESAYDSLKRHEAYKYLIKLNSGE